MPWIHPGTGEVYDTIPEQIERLTNSGCWRGLGSFLVGGLVVYAGISVVPLYWEWASSFTFTPYPNLNGAIITSVFTIGIVLLWKIGIIPLALKGVGLLIRIAVLLFIIGLTCVALYTTGVSIFQWLTTR